MSFLRQFCSYIGRLYWEQSSYKTAMTLGLVTAAISLLQFLLLADFIRRGNQFPGIAEYGGDLIGFFLSGSVFTGFVTVCLGGFSHYLQSEQQTGTLESVVVAPTTLTRTMSFAGVAGLLGTTAGSTLMIVVFGSLFRVRFDVGLGATVAVLGSLVVTLSGFGLAGTGVLLVTKRGDPITWLFTTATTLLSGVLYPVSILPGWLQEVSAWLPTTIALHGLRLAILDHADLDQVIPVITRLLAWMCVVLPLGIAVFRTGLHRASRTGTIADY